MKVPAAVMAQALEGYDSIPEKARYERQRTLYRIHRVSRGETLSRIAKRYGVKVAILKQLNAFKNRKRLSVGQRIMIPDGF